MLTRTRNMLSYTKKGGMQVGRHGKSINLYEVDDGKDWKLASVFAFVPQDVCTIHVVDDARQVL